MARRGFTAVRTWTCPHHPDGPPTLPADGYEREELTVEQAYEPAEIRALLRVVSVAARTIPASARTVERTLGLCCLGHRWKISGFRPTSRSEETVASMCELLGRFTPTLMPASILLEELERGFHVNVQPGTSLPIRIPLVRDVGDDTADES